MGAAGLPGARIMGPRERRGLFAAGPRSARGCEHADCDRVWPRSHNTVALEGIANSPESLDPEIALPNGIRSSAPIENYAIANLEVALDLSRRMVTRAAGVDVCQVRISIDY